jgi:hypothetical protein
VSHKTGNSGLSGVSGFSGKPEPAESAVPCSLLRQGLKFAWGGAGTNHRSHHYLAKAPAFASGTGELITRCEPPNFFASFSRVSRAPFPIFRGSLKGQRSHVGCHAPAGNVHGAKFCFPHELAEDSRNLRTNDGVRRSTFTEGAIMERAEYHRHSRARMAETAKDASRRATPDAPERIDHRRRCTRHDHRTCCHGSRGSASLPCHTRSGSNPRPLCLTDVYFGQQWLLINLISDNDCGNWDK